MATHSNRCYRQRRFRLGSGQLTGGRETTERGPRDFFPSRSNVQDGSDWLAAPSRDVIPRIRHTELPESAFDSGDFKSNAVELMPLCNEDAQCVF